MAGAALGAALGLAIGAAHAAAPVGVYGGNAYGTSGSLDVGPLAISLGPTAYIPCPCLGTNGEILSNKTAGVSVGLNGAVLRAGAISSAIRTVTTSTTATNVSTNKVTGVVAFKGLISADAVIAVSRITATATTLRSDDNGASFVNLKVAGRAVDPDVAPNTVLALPGLGTLTLRQQVVSGNGKTGLLLTENMIAIKITEANAYGLPIGASLVVGHAASKFLRSIPENLYSGGAFATQASASADGLLSSASGATALVAVGCSGTKGVLLTAKIETSAVGSIFGVGAGRTTALADNGTTKTTATIDQASLLGGMIRVSNIRAVAVTSIVNGKVVRSTKGSSVAGLRILGLPVPITVQPNTKVALPGIGYVIVNEQIVPSASSDKPTVVGGLRVVITKTNALGLPIGANIVLARAIAGVSKAPAGS